MKNTTIIYLGYTTNLDDPRNAVTLGTSTIEGMACREWSKHMKIFGFILAMAQKQKADGTTGKIKSLHLGLIA